MLVAGRHDDAELWPGRDWTPALLRRPSCGRDQTRVFDSRHEAPCALRNVGKNFRGVIVGHMKLSDCRSALKLLIPPTNKGTPVRLRELHPEDASFFLYNARR
jgi:hypothetical protein